MTVTDPATRPDRPTFVPFRGEQESLFGDVSIPPPAPEPKPEAPETEPAPKPKRAPRERLCSKCREPVPAGTATSTEPASGTRETSGAARESMREHAGRLRAAVLDTIRRLKGATCDRVEERLKLTHQTASARVHELMKAGDIVDSGKKANTRSGRKAIVWKVAPKS